MKKRRWSERSEQERKDIRHAAAERKQLLQELKAHPCMDCGLEYATAVMEFDHVPGRGGKLGAVSGRPSITAMLEEARKCDLVCANCHRIRTEKRRHRQKLEWRDRKAYLDGIAAAVEHEREVRRGL